MQLVLAWPSFLSSTHSGSPGYRARGRTSGERKGPPSWRLPSQDHAMSHRRQRGPHAQERSSHGSQGSRGDPVQREGKVRPATTAKDALRKYMGYRPGVLLPALKTALDQVRTSLVHLRGRGFHSELPSGTVRSAPVRPSEARAQRGFSHYGLSRRAFLVLSGYFRFRSIPVVDRP